MTTQGHFEEDFEAENLEHDLEDDVVYPKDTEEPVVESDGDTVPAEAMVPVLIDYLRSDISVIGLYNFVVTETPELVEPFRDAVSEVSIEVSRVNEKFLENVRNLGFADVVVSPLSDFLNRAFVMSFLLEESLKSGENQG